MRKRSGDKSVIVPEDYPDRYDGYLDYLQDYEDALLLGEEYVPFWVQTLIGCMEMIGPETEPGLEHMTALLLKEPTYEHLNKSYPALIREMRSVSGPNFNTVETRIGLKYLVIRNLLDGLLPTPFDGLEWSASFGYAMRALDSEDSKEAILEQRIKIALREYIPK